MNLSDLFNDASCWMPVYIIGGVIFWIVSGTITQVLMLLEDPDFATENVVAILVLLLFSLLWPISLIGAMIVGISLFIVKRINSKKEV